jgi:hypothetical protein
MRDAEFLALPFVRGRPISIESQLREKLRKIETLFAGASTAGERLAAEAALAVCGKTKKLGDLAVMHWDCWF